MAIPRETLDNLQGAIELVRVYLEDLESVNSFHSEDPNAEGNESAIVNAQTALSLLQGSVDNMVF